MYPASYEVPPRYGVLWGEGGAQVRQVRSEQTRHSGQADSKVVHPLAGETRVGTCNSSTRYLISAPSHQACLRYSNSSRTRGTDGRTKSSERAKTEARGGKLSLQVGDGSGFLALRHFAGLYRRLFRKQQGKGSIGWGPMPPDRARGQEIGAHDVDYHQRAFYGPE